MTAPTLLTVTPLEDRTVPTILGVTWPDAQNLTVSFAPDGTDVGGVGNSLAAVLQAAVGEGVWQAEIRRAFQTWAAVTNIDIHVVGDAGDALGTSAMLQGNPRNGDIRVAARPLSSSQLAVANPPDLVSGWSGEIVLNTNYAFSAGGAGGTYDLHSVMLHEIGHSLGLGHAPPGLADVMSEDYVGRRAGLSTADVKAIQTLYGVREADANEGKKGNESIKRATDIDYLATHEQGNNNIVAEGAVSSIVRADLTAASDVDVYRVAIPGDSTAAALALTAANVSLLAAKVTVTDEKGVVLLSATAARPGSDLSLDLSALPKGKTYYVKVEAARTDAFGVGGYRLAVGEAAPVAAAGAFVSAYSSGGVILESNDPVTGVDLGTLRDNADARWDAVGRSQLASATDAQSAVVAVKDAANALVVAVWANGDISPTLHVTDKHGGAVPFQVLRADGFATLIQILGVAKNEKFTFTLSSANWKATGPVNYRFAGDLRANPIVLTTFANGNLTAAAPNAARSFTVTQSQLFRFELTAKSPQPGASAALTISKSDGNEVFRLTAAAGQTLAADVFLVPGTYTVKITAFSSNGSLQPLGVLGRVTTLTDPIGPSLLDPTAPLDQPTTTTTTTIDPSGPSTTTGTTTTDSSFFWGYSLVDPLRIWW